MLDINMPRMDGLSLLETLQQRDDRKSAIIVSAYGDMTNIRTAMNHGAFGFLAEADRLFRSGSHDPEALRHVEALREAHRRQTDAERAHASLSRYFSPELPKRLVDGNDDEMAVNWRQIGVIFTDITGFTSLVEMVAPEQLAKLLNEYVGGLTNVVLDHQERWPR